MKATVSFLGFTSCVLMILGSLFKIQHWPGAGPMLVLGASIFSMFFCLFYLIYRIQNKKSKLDAFEGTMMSGTLSILAIGAMFKVQHWPGAGVMLTVSVSALAFIILPLLVIKVLRSKDKLESLNVIHVMIIVAFICMTFAINTSREVLHGFQINAEAIQENNELLNSWEPAYGNLSENAVLQVESITELTRETYDFIENYKRELIKKTERYDDDMPQEYYQIDYLRNRDNYDIPTHLMIGGNEGQIREDGLSASVLKSTIHQYRNELLKKVSNAKSKEKIESILALNDFGEFEHESWEMRLFYHQPLVSVLSTLNTLQNKVLIAQTIALNEARFSD